MNYLLLVAATLGISAQDVLRKRLDRRGAQPAGAAMAMNLVLAAVVLLFFAAVSGFRMEWHGPTLMYALAYAVTYALTMYFSMLAVAAGPLSLTSLAMPCSMLLPAIHGALFLGEPFGAANMIGLALLLCALCLVCLDRRARCEKRWYGYVAIVFVSNGSCTIIQKLHQMRFAGAYKSELMVCAMAAIVLVCLVCMLRYRRAALPALHHVWRCAAGVGLCNSIVNFLVMYLSIRLPAAVMYPAISGGSLLASCLAACLLFREPLPRRRAIGIVCGIAAVVIMNL